MKDHPDFEDEPGDRVDAGVAEVEPGVEGGEGMMGTSMQGAGIDLDHAMSIESPERPRAKSTTPEEEDRGDEMGGEDSTLTDLRGGAGSPSPHDPTRPSPLRMAYNTPHPLAGQNGYYPDSMSQSHSQTSSTSNTYPHYDPTQNRTGTRTQAQQTLYDYPLATYDPLNPPYTDSNASSSPTYHARLSSLPWDFHYNNQQHHQQQPQHQTPQPPSRPQTSTDNPVPPHHMYTNPTNYIDQLPHIHTHMPSIPGPSQNQHQHHPQSHPHPHPPQYQNHAFPLARDPYSPHQYAFSDPQHIPSGSGGPRYGYDRVIDDAIGGQAEGSGSGGERRLGHGQRRTSLDSGQTGKKPITTSRLGLDPVAKQERRREQNRVAQRAFRARAKIREQERSDDLDDDNQNEDVFDAR